MPSELNRDMEMQEKYAEQRPLDADCFLALLFVYMCSMFNKYCI